MLNFEKVRALMSSCIILHELQNLQVSFDTSHDDFRCLKVQLL